MTSLLDYDLLVNEVFYRCWHILEYIEKHPDLPDLERQAIEATIMDALVSKKLIDPTSQSLDLQNLCIVDNLDHYKYEEHPNICGIPLWMKEKFRNKCVEITGGIPISIYLARPPRKFPRYCVYDPNTSVSAIFDDATFYNAVYTSPTRGVRLEDTRPFVEVEINGELYLVDTLTKRILKSSWFKETYDMEIRSETTISKLAPDILQEYKKDVSERNGLGEYLALCFPMLNTEMPDFAEQRYEIEKSKELFPKEWEKCEEIQQEIEMFKNNNCSFLTKLREKKSS